MNTTPFMIFQRLMRLTKIDRKRGCYIYTGPKSGYKGSVYGKLTVRVRGRPQGVSTHKLSQETFNKKVPLKAPAGKRWEVGHRCHNSLCWFPGHVRPILNTTNIRERDARRAA